VFITISLNQREKTVRSGLTKSPSFYTDREIIMQTKLWKDLELGDIVQILDGPFGTAIVKAKQGLKVTFFRPYGVTADFTYTGGVICYTGVEEWTEEHQENVEVLFWRETPLK
jgi:hypothetical protein